MLEINKMDVYHGDLQALWDVSIIIEDGEITALVGSNGAGKSTTLMTISGLLRPARGNINFDGVRLDKQPAHKIVELGISMVPEGRRLFPELSVRDNLELGGFARKARQVKDKNFRWIFEVFPILQDRANQRANTLSGGEQQMLAIGRALMSQPKLLLIDELSLGLAPIVVQNIVQILKEINKTRGIAIFIVEQNVRMALELAVKAYVLENGRIIRQGDAKVLLESGQIKEAYLGGGPIGGEFK